MILAGGYDSDVEREKKIDYQSKIYAAPIREAGAGIKPHLQEDKPGRPFHIYMFLNER